MFFKDIFHKLPCISILIFPLVSLCNKKKKNQHGILAKDLVKDYLDSLFDSSADVLEAFLGGILAP